MRLQTGKSSGRFQGRPAAQESTVFDRALRSVYDGARAMSNPELRWVKNPRNGRRVGTIKRELGLLVFERQAIESKHRLRMMGRGMGA